MDDAARVKREQRQNAIRAESVEPPDLFGDAVDSGDSGDEYPQKLIKSDDENGALTDDVDDKKENIECKSRFKEWLVNDLKLSQYLANFEENHYDDIRMIQQLDQDTINNDIGITNKLHCKWILSKANAFIKCQEGFDQVFERNKSLEGFKKVLKDNGIFILDDLMIKIKTKLELGNMLKIFNRIYVCFA